MRNKSHPLNTMDRKRFPKFCICIWSYIGKSCDFLITICHKFFLSFLVSPQQSNSTKCSLTTDIHSYSRSQNIQFLKKQNVQYHLHKPELLPKSSVSITDVQQHKNKASRMVHHAKNCMHGNADKDVYLLRCYATFSGKYVLLKQHSAPIFRVMQAKLLGLPDPENEALCSY